MKVALNHIKYVVVQQFLQVVARLSEPHEPHEPPKNKHPPYYI